MPLPQPATQDDTLSELLELINRQLTEKGLKVEKASAAVIDATTSKLFSKILNPHDGTTFVLLLPIYPTT